jgi:hypothetical protein
MVGLTPYETLDVMAVFVSVIVGGFLFFVCATI